MLRIKSINELPKKDDGFRILIDESWPKGLSKEEAKVDLWLKDITPTNLEELSEKNSINIKEIETEYCDEFREKNTLIKMFRDTEKEKGTVNFLLHYKKHKAAAV